jgi:hypothetical protein
VACTSSGTPTRDTWAPGVPDATDDDTQDPTGDWAIKPDLTDATQADLPGPTDADLADLADDGHAGQADLDDAAHDLLDDASTDSPDATEVDAETRPAADTEADTCAPPEAPWTRRPPRGSGPVVFSQLTPSATPAQSSLTLLNPMTVTVDLSGWTLSGDIAYTFPEGTRLDGRASLVLTAASWSGTWPRSTAPLAGLIEFRNPLGRLIDAVEFDAGPWPESPLPLAKSSPTAPSSFAESWQPALPLIEPHTPWRVSDVDALTAADPNFDDTSWPTVTTPVTVGAALSPASLTMTADNHVAAYLGQADGSDLRLVGRDREGDWTSPETFDLDIKPGDHLFFAAWEAPGDSGSPQMLIAQWRVGDKEDGTSRDTFEARLGPANANPGDALNALPPSPALLASLTASGWSEPAVSQPPNFPPWGFALGAFSLAEPLWLDTFDADSLTNREDTFALFRTRAPLASSSPDTSNPVAPRTWFRGEFDLPAAVLPHLPALEPTLTLTVDDGAIVFLNGLEVARTNLPETGPITATTPALRTITRPSPATLTLPVAPLRAGRNTLAIAVHQASPDVEPNPDLAFDATFTLGSRPIEYPPSDSPLVISEIMFHGPTEAVPDWLELTNISDAPVDATGFTLVDAVAMTLPSGLIIAPREAVVVTRNPSAFVALYPGITPVGSFSGNLASDGEQVTLLDPCGHIADRVPYLDGGRWPAAADGGGSSLELIDLRANNASPEAWAASDETDKTAWQQFVIDAPLTRSAVGPDGLWHELILGLLDDGEVLIDDVSLIEDPAGAARELIAHGNFEGLPMTAPALGSHVMGPWRALGTHATSRLIEDPDAPGNHVLALIATGPTEHMHNQLVTTLAAPLQDGLRYTLRFRARWRSGTDLLNSRLYFNRLARTHRVERPRTPGTPGAPNSTRLDNLGPTFDDLTLSPVVPTPEDPVEVAVHLADPDDVEAATLWTSVEGGPWTATPMSPSANGYWSTTLPPFGPYPSHSGATGPLVHFYIEATDTRAASSYFPARGPDARALFQVDDRNLASGPLPTLRVLMTEADAAIFYAPTEVMSNAPVAVTVVVDDPLSPQVAFDIATRPKGSERARMQPARFGHSLRFDPAAPFRGIFDNISLDRSEGVITGQRELLIDLLMADAGSVSAEYNDLAFLIAPRPEHTGPVILQTARFSDLMLASQFPDGDDGNLYEYELIYHPYTTDTGAPDGLKIPEPDGVVGAWFSELGLTLDPEAFRHIFLLKNNRSDDDFTPVAELCRVFALPEPEFRAALPDVIDIDQWLRAFALMTLSGAVDHFGAGAQHNVQLYARPEDGRILLFPHDLDFYPWSPDMPVVGSPDLARILAIPGQRRAYYGHLQNLLAHLDPATIDRWSDHLGDLLPAQPFASHGDFAKARGAYLTSGAPDSITAVFPFEPFALSSPSTLPHSFADGPLRLEGRGWIDIATIAVTKAGLPLPTTVTWLDDQRWQASLYLPRGTHDLLIEARGRRVNPIHDPIPVRITVTD